MPTPTEIKYIRKGKTLKVSFDSGETFELTAEFLRVHSPSAEVRGHGGPMKLEAGKAGVGIDAIEPVGNYAVRLMFDDGHSTGLFSWTVLYELGSKHDELWQAYLDRLAQAGHTRGESR